VTGGLIELDVSQPWEPEETAQGSPAPRPVPRWLVPALVMVVAAGTVAASVPPRRWDPVLTLRSPNGSAIFGPDDTAFVSFQRIRSGRIQAFRPGRPEVLWTADFPGTNPVPMVTDDPGLLIISLFQAEPAQRVPETSVQGRDAHTGRVLWTRPGLGLLGIAGDVVLLTDHRASGSTTPEAIGAGEVGPDGIPRVRGGTVLALDRHTGDMRWTRTLDADAVLGREDLADSGEPLIAELRADGTLRITDPATGAARRILKVALSGRPLTVSLLPDVAVVRQVRPDDTGPPFEGPGPAPPTITGYDLTTGATRWRYENLRYGGVCGAGYLCDFGTETTVMDPRTGTTVYRGAGDGLIFHGDRLVVSWTTAQAGPPTGATLHDLRTGRRLRTFGRWHLVAYEPDRPALAAQATSLGHLVVVVLNLATGAVTVVGRDADWFGDPACSWGRRYVACAGPSGVRIWRLPAAFAR
jgi:outer membrane protein assembly factor BamB